MINQNKWGHWQVFRSEIGDRIVTPCYHPMFVLYFFFIILIVGGLGVWLPILYRILNVKELGENWWIGVLDDLFTYSIAILAASAADLILSVEKSNLIMRFATITMLPVSIVLAVISQAGLNSDWATAFAIIGTVIALFFWWIANADNVRLVEPPPPLDAPTGGDINRDLAGDLADIKI